MFLSRIERFYPTQHFFASELLGVGRRRAQTMRFAPRLAAADLPNRLAPPGCRSRRIHLCGKRLGKALELHLDAVEKRVLGSLMEKDMTTPEYYPLTLNALLAACNQKSNREPVMEVDEAAVRAALRSLEEKGLAGAARVEGRVARFEHRMGEALNLGRRESALLCTLLLRGPRRRASCEDAASACIAWKISTKCNWFCKSSSTHDPPLVKLLPRQPGTKEARYADLFRRRRRRVERWCARQSAKAPAATASREERITTLEAEIAQLRAEIEALRQQFADFRGQFES